MHGQQNVKIRLEGYGTDTTPNSSEFMMIMTMTVFDLISTYICSVKIKKRENEREKDEKKNLNYVTPIGKVTMA